MAITCPKHQSIEDHLLARDGSRFAGSRAIEVEGDGV
jgi:hypothetical protein